MENEFLKLQLEALENKSAIFDQHHQNETYLLKERIKSMEQLSEIVAIKVCDYQGLTRPNMVSSQLHSKNPKFSHDFFGVMPSFKELVIFLRIMFPDVSFNASVTGKYLSPITSFEMILIWLLVIHGGFTRSAVATIYDSDYSTICKIVLLISPHMGALGMDLSNLDVNSDYFDISRPLECREYFLKTGDK